MGPRGVLIFVRSKSDLLLSGIDLPVAVGFTGQVNVAKRALFRNRSAVFSDRGDTSKVSSDRLGNTWYKPRDAPRLLSLQPGRRTDSFRLISFDLTYDVVMSQWCSNDHMIMS